MCIILMNLTIGLSISNIQDLRKNADGLRLVKEVLLQRYLESLLQLISSTLPLVTFMCPSAEFQLKDDSRLFLVLKLSLFL